MIWGQLSGGNRRLTLNKFFYDYKPQHISSSQGIYHFLVRKMSLRLVSNMLDSNKNLKNRYFFIQWMDWVCRPEEWDTMPNGFDNTWGIVKKLGGPSVFTFPICLLCHASTLFFVFVFSLDTSVNYRWTRGLHPSRIRDSSWTNEVEGSRHPWYPSHILWWPQIDASNSTTTRLLLST